MDFADVLNIGGRGAAVNLKGAIAVAEFRFRADDPGVVVAEDAGVFLVSGRIAADFAQLQMIAGIGRLQEHDAVFRIEPLFHALQRKRCFAGLFADAGHHAHTLRLNVNLPFLTVFAAHHVSKSVIGAAEPFAVPACVEHGLLHC